MRHWTFSIDSEGLGHLVLDHADARVNTLGSEVLAELDQALAEIEQARPKASSFPRARAVDLSPAPTSLSSMNSATKCNCVSH